MQAHTRICRPIDIIVLRLFVVLVVLLCGREVAAQEGEWMRTVVPIEETLDNVSLAVAAAQRVAMCLVVSDRVYVDPSDADAATLDEMRAYLARRGISLAGSVDDCGHLVAQEVV